MVADAPHEFTLVVDRSTADECELPRGARLLVVETRERPTRAASATTARSPADLWRLARAASRQRFDAFLFPAVYSFYPLLRRMPTVVAFHDAIAERHPDLVFPGWRQRLFWRLKTAVARRQADLILTVSRSAKDEIVRVFGSPETSVRVIPEAAGSEFRPLADAQALCRVQQRYGLPKEGPLILHVGGFSPHKNLGRLLEALVGLDSSSPPWHLVLAGDHADVFHSAYLELRAAVAEAGFDHRVTFTGHVPDPDLVVLYNAATMLVLPSLAEGFGLPAIEAMACGLPVVASRRGSVPEVLGGAGLLFDPTEPEDIRMAISRVLTDPSLRDRMKRAGLERARAFSWHTAAHQTVSLLEEVARA